MLAGFLTCILALLFSLPVSAANPVVTGANTVPLVVLGGVLTGTIGAATAITNLTLDGTDKTPTYTIPIIITDLSGTHAGWNLTITSTQFTTVGTPTQTLATSASNVTGIATVGCTIVCTNPTNSITYPVQVPAGTTAPTAVEFYSAAANTGVGGPFTITPTIAVSVPALTHAGASPSVVTVALNSGP